MQALANEGSNAQNSTHNASASGLRSTRTSSTQRSRPSPSDRVKELYETETNDDGSHRYDERGALVLTQRALAAQRKVCLRTPLSFLSVVSSCSMIFRQRTDRIIREHPPRNDLPVHLYLDPFGLDKYPILYWGFPHKLTNGVTWRNTPLATGCPRTPSPLCGNS